MRLNLRARRRVASRLGSAARLWPTSGCCEDQMFAARTNIIRTNLWYEGVGRRAGFRRCPVSCFITTTTSAPIQLPSPGFPSPPFFYLEKKSAAGLLDRPHIVGPASPIGLLEELQACRARRRWDACCQHPEGAPTLRADTIHTTTLARHTCSNVDLETASPRAPIERSAAKRAPLTSSFTFRMPNLMLSSSCHP